MGVAALLTVGFLPPLADPRTGQPYPVAALPCSSNPTAWDEDAEAPTRLAAAQACWTCPAIVACDQRREQLGDLATGVWAAVLVAEQERVPQVYDATVAWWIVQSGTTLREADR